MQGKIRYSNRGINCHKKKNRDNSFDAKTTLKVITKRKLKLYVPLKMPFLPFIIRDWFLVYLG